MDLRGVGDAIGAYQSIQIDAVGLGDPEQGFAALNGVGLGLLDRRRILNGFRWLRRLNWRRRL